MVFSLSFVLIAVVASFSAFLFDLGSLLIQTKTPAAFLWLFAGWLFFNAVLGIEVYRFLMQGAETGWVSILAFASMVYTFLCAHVLCMFFRDWLRHLHSKMEIHR